jgi:hypothetical protein
MKNLQILAIFCIILILGCNKTPTAVTKVLRKAGDNRHELQKVIDHYKISGERKKLKAAYFLISNMENKFSVSGEGIDNYYKALKEVTALKNHGVKRDSLDKLVKIKIDSLEKGQGKLDLSKLKRTNDIEVITADFLIKNIDLAFEVWKKPWAKHVGFDDFCEFILPYRIHNEPLSNWRESFYKQLISFQDSLRDLSDPKELVTKLSFYLYKKWTHLDNFTSYNIYPDPIEMSVCNGGLCDHRYYLFTAMCRSIGLPVSIESTPQWTNYTGGHAWNVLLDNNGGIRPFNGAEDNMRFYEKNLVPMGDGGSICTKVYRRTFAVQDESLPSNTKSSIPKGILNEKCLMDVTENYDFPKTSYVLKFENDDLENKIVYLCTFNYGFDINYVAWAKVKHNKADFKYIGLPAFYIPVTYFNNQIEMVHTPLVLYKEEEKRHEYAPDLSKKATVRLYRKFNFSGDFISFAKGMMKSKLQGSNKPDFSDAIDLATINNQAKGWEEAKIKVPSKFRYLRYLSNDSDEVRIAEIEFWGKENEKDTPRLLKGKIIGNTTSTDLENDAIYKNAFDENMRTNFNAKHGSWAGIDLEDKPAQVTSVWYIPRNNYNEIEMGHVYELFYLDDRWVSLGRQVANKHILEFHNTPIEALLLLKDLTEGKQERVFFYDVEKQEQEWW